jgi:prephenate dehydratase
MKVAFQGETGAYSEEAVFALSPDSTPIPCTTFEQVFIAVRDATVDCGVIPIENSLHGSVHENYDLLQEFSLVISGEVQLRIRHHLLGLPGSSPDEIRQIYSHPQALGQCRSFLRTHFPEAELVPSYDTAGAAKMIAERGRLDAAAIASVRAADEYRLIVHAESIESNHNNYTRFLWLSLPETTAVRAVPAGSAPRQTEQAEQPGTGTTSGVKTSIVYAQHENVPGSLFKSLAVFALRDIDLLKIESRPLVGSPGKYLFYLDLGGSIEDESVKNALRHLEEVAASVKVLGSYLSGRQIN